MCLSRAEAERELAEILQDKPGWRGSLTIKPVMRTLHELIAEPSSN
jgi:hypothetical protein